MEAKIRVKHVGAPLKRLRVAQGLTQADVAQRLQYDSPQFISNWERGISLPPDAVLPVLSRLYRVPLKHLVNRIALAKMADLDAWKKSFRAQPRDAGLQKGQR